MLDLDFEKWIVYFEKAGKVNTEKTLVLAKKRGQELGIKNVVLASTHGYTAQIALKIFENTNVKFITIGTNRELFSGGLLQSLEEKKLPVIFTNEVEYTYPQLMRNALKKLSEGMKVCMEIGMAAREKKLIPKEEEVIAIAGTSPRGFDDGGGADTAIVMLPWTSEEFSKLPEKAKRRDIKEIICKPR